MQFIQLNDYKYLGGMGMDLFRKKIGPVFVKKDSDVKEYIENK